MRIKKHFPPSLHLLWVFCDPIFIEAKQPPEVFYKKRCFKKFRNIHRKAHVLESLLHKVGGVKGWDFKQRRCREYYEIFHNTYFKKDLQTAASGCHQDALRWLLQKLLASLCIWDYILVPKLFLGNLYPTSSKSWSFCENTNNIPPKQVNFRKVWVSRIHMKFVSPYWLDKNYYVLFQMNYNASFISRISYGADWSWWKNHKTGWVLWCCVHFILISKIQNSFWDRMKNVTEIHCSCVMKGQLYIFFKVTFFSRCRTVFHTVLRLFQYGRHHIGKKLWFFEL